MFETFMWVIFIGVIVFLGYVYISNYMDKVEKNQQLTEYEQLKLENERLLNKALKDINSK